MVIKLIPGSDAIVAWAVEREVNAVELSHEVPSPIGGGLGWGQVESKASLPFDRPPPNLLPAGGGANSPALGRGAHHG